MRIELAAIMNTTADECQKKMKFLLTALRREKQKMKKSMTVGTDKDTYYNNFEQKLKLETRKRLINYFFKKIN